MPDLQPSQEDAMEAAWEKVEAAVVSHCLRHGEDDKAAMLAVRDFGSAVLHAMASMPLFHRSELGPQRARFLAVEAWLAGKETE